MVLSSGLLEAIEDGSLPDEQAAAVIAHAAGLVRGGLVRQDPVLAFWTLPWQLLRAICQAISSAGARLPLTSLAWRLRVVVIGVAVVQCLAQHQLWLAVTIGCIGAVSYAMPVWERRWHTMLTDRGDDAADAAGLPGPLWPCSCAAAHAQCRYGAGCTAWSQARAPSRRWVWSADPAPPEVLDRDGPTVDSAGVPRWDRITKGPSYAAPTEHGCRPPRLRTRPSCRCCRSRGRGGVALCARL